MVPLCFSSTFIAGGGIQSNQKITEATAKIPAASVIISYFLFKFPHRLIQRHSLGHRIPAQAVDLLDLLHLLARQDITAHRKNRKPPRNHNVINLVNVAEPRIPSVYRIR